MRGFDDETSPFYIDVSELWEKLFRVTTTKVMDVLDETVVRHNEIKKSNKFLFILFVKNVKY